MNIDGFYLSHLSDDALKIAKKEMLKYLRENGFDVDRRLVINRLKAVNSELSRRIFPSSGDNFNTIGKV